LDEIKQLVKKIEIFNHLNEELEEIASKFTIETFNIGEIIIQQEEQANNWFIIIEGKKTKLIFSLFKKYFFKLRYSDYSSKAITR